MSKEEVRAEVAAPERYRDAPDNGLTGAERAVAALRAGIRAGRFVPGQRLVEADLTREFQVGRNSLREAFSRLRSEGLLAVEPHRGASVRRLSRDDVAALYEISEVLEGLAARRAAQRAGRPGHTDRLAEAVGSLHGASAREAPGVALDADAAFHQCIAELAEEQRLHDLIDRLHIQTFTFQLRHADPRDLGRIHEVALVEHRDVAAAITAGDPGQAEDLMRSHIRHARERFLALPDHNFT